MREFALSTAIFGSGVLAIKDSDQGKVTQLRQQFAKLKRFIDGSPNFFNILKDIAAKDPLSDPKKKISWILSNPDSATTEDIIRTAEFVANPVSSNSGSNDTYQLCSQVTF